MTEQDEKQLWVEIEHIFDSGANELRVFNMVKGFIEKRYQALHITTVSGSRFQSAYAQYWDMVKDIIDEEGWVYTKEAPHMLDVYFEGNTGKSIEFQKSFGKSGDNPYWLTRGSRWRPLELS